jgi:hypothetical protein
MDPLLEIEMERLIPGSQHARGADVHARQQRVPVLEEPNQQID